MANINANIANRLMAYIRHGVDINSDIKEIYKNSLIFIGDESQIYVPAMNTYVGIGTTAYNNTIQRIKSIEDQLSSLDSSLGADMVSKIYVNYSLDEVNGLNGKTAVGGFSAGLTDTEWALNNDVTIKGVGDYDPATGLAKKNTRNDSSRYHSYTANYYDGTAGTKEIYVAASEYYNADAAQPTSGITVTPHWGTKQTVYNEATGQTIVKRSGNYITIDDSLTWSYMTSAYAYALDYTKTHTASEIDRLYHNLLGDSSVTYLPVAFDTVIDDRTSIISKLTAKEIAAFDTDNPGKHLITVDINSTKYYYVVSTDVEIYYAYIDNNTPAEGTAGNKEYVKLTYTDIEDLIVNGLSTLHQGTVRYTAGNASIENFPQLYSRDVQYNSTYNINIKDGIQTLKEVAYLLDLLSDGNLGSVTYYTYADFNALTEGEQESAYYIQPQNPTPADNDIYAYIVNTGDPENLGIQIAYSIAGNQAQITDLHTHIEKLESGKTSVRSVQASGTEFTTVSVFGQSEWSNTDTDNGRLKAGHPNYVAPGVEHMETPSYLVGDVNIRIAINTGLVYATVYQKGDAPVNYHYVDGFGVNWYGCYTEADHRALTADGTYYTASIQTETGTGYAYAVMTKVTNPETDPYQQAPNTQYYWIPNPDDSKNDKNQNIVWEKVGREELMALDADDYLPNSTIKKSECTDFYTLGDNGYVNSASSDSDKTAADKAVGLTNYDTFFFIAGHTEFEIHAKVGENKIATTEWVGAYLNDTLSDITSTLDNLIEEANKYTRKRIEDLDTNFAYSDFATYWTSYSTTYNLQPGTPEYESAYEREYNDYVERGEDEAYIFGDSGEYRLSYKSRSQYVYNIVEEDGMVSAETRELPSDTISAKVEIYGAESSSSRHQYAVLVNDTPHAPLYETLYNWKHQSTGDNQLFAPVADSAYIPIEPTTAKPAGTVYYFRETDHQYVIAALGTTIPMTDYTDTKNKNWVQLYSKGVKYEELDLNDWSWEDKEKNILKVGRFTLEKVTSGADANKIKVSADGTEIGFVSYISERAAESTRYFTATSKHFSYAESGNGENKLEITAHVTSIEDASTTNTGFADAYDVQRYIASMFTWVDISASSTEALISASDKYYSHITYADYTSEKLYGRTMNGDTPKYDVVSSPITAYYWKDDNTYYGLTQDGRPDETTLDGGAHIKIDGTYLYVQFAADHTMADRYTNDSNYYVRLEDPTMNPINLTETLYK